MGNSGSREARQNNERASGQHQGRSPTSPTFSFSLNPPPNDRQGAIYNARGGRASRGDLSLFSLASSGDVDPNGQRRETKEERDRRRAEKERVSRAKERERSMREEGVDGGYLVTLGTYVGPEDFTKRTVRQLMIDRRLAPFWRGLNDHSDSWTEHQLVAAARGQPIPPPDQIPSPEESPSPTEDRRVLSGNSTTATQGLTSFSGRGSSESGQAATQSLSATLASSSPGGTPSPLVRGRTKPLAPLSSASNTSDSDITRHEIQLPKNSQINGQPLEAYLYKDVAECPICFLYYPPYLNRTRCCDQPICSECFVQIKRPEPHPPEHTDPNSSPPENAPPPEEEGQLISEPATCPFCKVPELGVSYDPPPFRRGLAYTVERGTLGNRPSDASSRRPRGQSLSVNHPDVITTDTVRSDWDKKLADARMHLGRRAAAATALHNAAYMMNSERGSGFPGLGRRRRQVLVDSGQGSSNGGAPRPEHFDPRQLEQIMAAMEAARNGNLDDIFPRRASSRGESSPDIEQYLMARAIRESLQDEEERRRKAAKEAEKERKKEEKQRDKDQKKAAKAAKKNGVEYPSSNNNSAVFQQGPSDPTQGVTPSSEGKGKARANESASNSSRTRQGYQPGGFNPLEEPTSTLRERDVHATEPFPSTVEPPPASIAPFSSNSDPFKEPGQSGLYLQAAGHSMDQTNHKDSPLNNDESNNSTSGPHPRGTTTDDSDVSEQASSQLSPQHTFLPPISFPDTSTLQISQNGNGVGTANTNADGTVIADGRTRGMSSASQSQPPQYQVSDQTRDHKDDVDSKHGGNVAVVGHPEST